MLLLYGFHPFFSPEMQRHSAALPSELDALPLNVLTAATPNVKSFNEPELTGTKLFQGKRTTGGKKV